jgi:hypothetical protein
MREYSLVLRPQVDPLNRSLTTGEYGALVEWYRRQSEQRKNSHHSPQIPHVLAWDGTGPWDEKLTTNSEQQRAPKSPAGPQLCKVCSTEGLTAYLTSDSSSQYTGWSKLLSGFSWLSLEQSPHWDMTSYFLSDIIVASTVLPNKTFWVIFSYSVRSFIFPSSLKSIFHGNPENNLESHCICWIAWWLQL